MDALKVIRLTIGVSAIIFGLYTVAISVNDRVDTTVICISQRVASVRHADLIAVLDHGRLAALGTHDELLASCALYREICLSQHVGEEVS